MHNLSVSEKNNKTILIISSTMFLQAAILYLAIFGNGIVLLVLRLRRQKLSRMQWFIAHLAIADLFVAFFNVLPQLMWDILRNFYGNDFLCKGVAYFQVSDTPRMLVSGLVTYQRPLHIMSLCFFNKILS